MENLCLHSTPDSWIAEVFAAQAVRKGGVIRRNVHWIAREIGCERFVEEVRQRGFRLLETGDQWIVICHGGGVRLLV
ncbi:N-(5'-phosphoribosyl)anthranilate isomerase [Paracoccaceae bacterium Fryx2]|nr:N-(5'-phosphoribosyl)anthranilate isomerase [Paracoccaceae bacterium Fryx2]